MKHKYGKGVRSIFFLFKNGFQIKFPAMETLTFKSLSFAFDQRHSYESLKYALNALAL